MRTCVGLHVFIEILLHVEVLATPLAHELLVPNMDAHVGAELVLVLKPLITVLYWTQRTVLNVMHRSSPEATLTGFLDLFFILKTTCFCQLFGFAMFLQMS